MNGKEIHIGAKNNFNEFLQNSNSHSKINQLILKDKHNSTNKITSRKNNSINLICTKKRRKNNSTPELIEEDNFTNINYNYVYDNNSVSYYIKKDKRKKNNNNNSQKNNMNDSNNMSNFILLQKNTRKSFTDINILQKEANSKIIDKNSLDERIGPKLIIHINNKQLNNRNDNNRIKINNFINKESNNHKYFLLYRQPTKMMKRCFICDGFNKKLFHTEKCSHFFCELCGKVFYEQQINNCIYNLKCPKYSCHKHLSIKILKLFLSKFIYEKLIDNLESNSQTYDKNLINTNQNINSSRERINKRNSLFSEDKENSQQQNQTYIYSLTYQKEYIFQDDSKRKLGKNDLLLKKITKKYNCRADKDLSNKHIIKLSGSSKFIKAVRKINEIKNTFCSQCNKASLFPVKNKPFIKCLNCGFSICKFCFKKYDYFHFVRNNAKACRVFFRANIIGRRQKYVYFYQLLYIFAGFLVLLIGFTKIEAKYLSKYNVNKIYLLYSLLFLIILLINCFIFAIFLPYYPLILLIVEF